MTIQISFYNAADMWSVFRSLTGLPLVKIITNAAIDPLQILFFNSHCSHLVLCGLKKPPTAPLYCHLPIEAGLSLIDGTPAENLAQLKLAQLATEERESKSKPTLVVFPGDRAA